MNLRELLKNQNKPYEKIYKLFEYINELKIYQLNWLIIVEKILVYKKRENYALVN